MVQAGVEAKAEVEAEVAIVGAGAVEDRTLSVGSMLIEVETVQTRKRPCSLDKPVRTTKPVTLDSSFVLIDSQLHASKIASATSLPAPAGDLYHNFW